MFLATRSNGKVKHGGAPFGESIFIHIIQQLQKKQTNKDRYYCYRHTKSNWCLGKSAMGVDCYNHKNI